MLSSTRPVAHVFAHRLIIAASATTPAAIA
jgi:hypothetical protein